LVKRQGWEFTLRSATQQLGRVPVDGFWVLFCNAATQLATQLQQRCIQVVCSNKEARKRLTESNGTPAMDLRHMNVVCLFLIGSFSRGNDVVQLSLVQFCFLVLNPHS